MATTSSISAAPAVDTDYTETVWCFNGTPILRRESIVSGVTAVAWFALDGTPFVPTAPQLASAVPGECCEAQVLYTLPAFPGLATYTWNDSGIPVAAMPTLAAQRQAIDGLTGRDIFGGRMPGTAPTTSAVVASTTLSGGAAATNEAQVAVGYLYATQAVSFRYAPPADQAYRSLSIGKCTEPPAIVLEQSTDGLNGPVSFGVVATVSPGVYSFRVDNFDFDAGANTAALEASISPGVWVPADSLITSGVLKFADTFVPTETKRYVNVCGSQVRELDGTTITLTANDSFFERLTCETCSASEPALNAYQTTLTTITGATATVPTFGLFAWSVRSRSATVTLTVNSDPAVTMDLGEVISSQAGENGTLRDNVVVNATGSARVISVARKPV